MLFFNAIPRVLGWGDLIIYSVVCYLRAKDFKCDDVHIILPEFKQWDSDGNGKDANISQEDFDYLPWKYHPSHKPIDIEEWDIIMNTSLYGSLYNGFPGLNYAVAYGGWFMYKFLERRYQETKIAPYLNIPREEREIPYILFHFRKAKEGNGFEKRNIDIHSFTKIYKIIKDELGNNFEYWKIGEESDIDNEFDKIIRNNYEINSNAKLIRNSSLAIGGSTGGIAFSYFFSDTPLISIDRDNFDPLIKKIWQKVVGNDTEQYGTWYNENHLKFYRGTPPNKKEIITFLKKQKLC